jgi:hypothetical protein
MTGSERRLVRGPGELPRDIAPSRDLWPAIASRIAATPQDAQGEPVAAWPPRAPRRPRAAWTYGLGLAATVACLAIGIWIGRTTAPPATGASAAVLATALAPDARFARERQALLVQAGLGLSRLAPEERRQVEASLATLRQAIADIRRALGEDPGNLLLQEMLVNSYQDEIRVLTAVKEAGGAGQEI